MSSNKTAVLLALVLAGGMAHAAPTNSFVTFDQASGGAQGWEGMQSSSGIGGTIIDPDFGVDAPAIRTKMDFPFIAWGNNTNEAYLGDWGQLGSVTISLDVNATMVQWGGKTVPRQLVVELRDYDNPTYGPWTSVLVLADYAGRRQRLEEPVCHDRRHQIRNAACRLGGYRQLQWR